jgi:CheY-like chemotaxis protein
MNMLDLTEIPEGISASEWVGWQQQFLAEGVERSRELLAGLDQRFDTSQIGHQMHQWAGSAGQLGFHNITESVRRIERLLNEAPPKRSEIREMLSDLLLAFSHLRDKLMGAVPDHVARILRGKSVALVGFPAERANRTCATLGRVDARPRLFSSADELGCESVSGCDIVIVQVVPETDRAKLQAAAEGSEAGKLFLTGERGILMALPSAVQSPVADYLFYNWEPEELLLRLALAVWRKAPTVFVTPAAACVAAFQTTEISRHIASGPRILVADDDPFILTLVRTALRNTGTQCQTVDNGRDALRIIREEKTTLVVLDVNMPGIDGYEVLSAIRAEELPTQVILLTARQQERDVLRGFQLGADDYLVKPFNPLELVARIKRLLSPARRVAA